MKFFQAYAALIPVQRPTQSVSCCSFLVAIMLQKLQFSEICRSQDAISDRDLMNAQPSLNNDVCERVLFALIYRRGKRWSLHSLVLAAESGVLFFVWQQNFLRGVVHAYLLPVCCSGSVRLQEGSRRVATLLQTLLYAAWVIYEYSTSEEHEGYWYVHLKNRAEGLVCWCASPLERLLDRQCFNGRMKVEDDRFMHTGRCWRAHADHWRERFESKKNFQIFSWNCFRTPQWFPWYN